MGGRAVGELDGVAHVRAAAGGLDGDERGQALVGLPLGDQLVQIGEDGVEGRIRQVQQAHRQRVVRRDLGHAPGGVQQVLDVVGVLVAGLAPQVRRPVRDGVGVAERHDEPPVGQVHLEGGHENLTDCTMASLSARRESTRAWESSSSWAVITVKKTIQSSGRPGSPT